MPEFFQIPTDQPDSDSHWDHAAARTIQGVSRAEAEAREWIIRDPRRAWSTALVLVGIAALGALAPLPGRAPSPKTAALPPEALGRVFVTSRESPSIGSLLLGTTSREAR